MLQEVLTQLQNEINAVEKKNYIQPPKPLQLGDVIVGEATEEIKKLWTLYGRTFEQAAKESLGITVLGLPQTGEGTNLVMKTKLLKELLWYILRTEYGLFDVDVVGLRLGFKVIRNDNADENFLDTLLTTVEEPAPDQPVTVQ